MRRAALRCCGRFCFYRLPCGPWSCTRCSRTFAAAMPASAAARLAADAAGVVWTAEQRELARRILRSTDPRASFVGWP